jgi:hypothetical protein
LVLEGERRSYDIFAMRALPPEPVRVRVMSKDGLNQCPAIFVTGAIVVAALVRQGR